MTKLPNPAAGFFRFPTRLAFRSLRVVRAERVECHTAHAHFRLRHVEQSQPLKIVPVDTRTASAPIRGPVARITVRV